MVGEDLDDTVVVVHRLLVLALLDIDKRQGEHTINILGSHLEEGAVVVGGEFVTTQLAVGITTIEESGGIGRFALQDVVICLDGIIPLLEFEIYGSLAQIEVG